MSMYDELAESCDVAFAMNLIGGKWKVSIIWELADGSPKRLSTLRRSLTGVSEGVLITQLKELERDGLVQRIDFHEMPPRVEYQLTDRSKSLLGALNELESWGREYRKRKKKAPSTLLRSLRFHSGG